MYSFNAQFHLQNGDMSVEEGMEYRDLLAAITAIYIDVIIAIGCVLVDLSLQEITEKFATL